MSKTFKLQPLPEPTEAEIQRDVLQYLKYDARVAWAHRFNTGAHVLDSMGKDGKLRRNFVRYAFPGCSDILGQMKDGRFLAIEVKTRRGRVADDQQRFLDMINANKGIGLVVRCIADAIEGLGK